MGYSKAAATGGNCGHKKSPSRMPVELVTLRRQDNATRQRNSPGSAGVPPPPPCPPSLAGEGMQARRPRSEGASSTQRVVQPDTPELRFLCRASISNYGEGRANPTHPRRKKVRCDRIGLIAVHCRIMLPTCLG